MQLQFRLICSRCRHNGLTVPDGPQDGDRITCPACKAVLCTVDDLNERIKHEAGEVAAQLLSDALDGIQREPPEIELVL